MKLDHIGYLTDDIEASARALVDLGYIKGQTYSDDIQKCFICFLRSDDNTIELVRPYEDNIPMNRLLKKRGTSPYHLCFEVEDVKQTFCTLSEKEGWIPLFAPVKAVAFNNRLITYFLNAETGYVEFVNEN